MLSAGRAVLCEKPFVATTEHAHALVALSAKHQSDLFVGHFRRLCAPARTARQIIASGLLGAPQSVVAVEGGRFNWQAKSAYTHNDPLGGVLYDTGSHLIDMVLFATGLDEQELDVSVQTSDRSPDVEPSHSVRAEVALASTGQSIALTIGLSRFELLANVIRVDCERGTLEFPAGPGERLRIRGENGDVTLPALDGATTFTGGFVEQLRRVVTGEDCEELAASRFVGVTQVLEAIIGYEESASDD